MNHAPPARSIEEELRIKSAELDKLKAANALVEAVQQRAESRLTAMRSTIADLNERLGEKSDEGLESEMRNRISVLESTLLQREEEIEQTRRELESHKRQSGTNDASFEVLRAKLDDANAWVFRLSGDRRNAELALQRAEAQYGRVERENSALVSEKSAASAAVTQLKARVEREALEKVAALDELATLRDGQQELARLRVDYRTATKNLIEREAAMADLGSDHAGLQREMKRLLEDLRVANTLASDRKFALDELALETRKQRDEMQVQNDLFSWLQLVALEIRRSRRWWFLLSKKKRSELLAQRLSLIGLFDAPSYLDRYPDVAEEGIDPLLHYLAHGMIEGRQR